MYSPHRKRFAQGLLDGVREYTSEKSAQWVDSKIPSLSLGEFKCLEGHNGGRLHVLGIVMLDDPRLFTYSADYQEIHLVCGIDALKWYVSVLYSHYLFHSVDILAIATLIFTYFFHQENPGYFALVPFLGSLVCSFISIVNAYHRFVIIRSCETLINVIQMELLSFHTGNWGGDSTRFFSLPLLNL